MTSDKPRRYFLTSPRYQGSPSTHFDGYCFHNDPSGGERGFFHFLKWMLTRRRGPWRRVPDATPGPPPPARVCGGGLRLTFINHATTLIQMDGLNILTDPIWSERCAPTQWAGPRRFRPPGLRFGDLPRIDLVLVSHNHYDHFDGPTLTRLAREHNPLFISALGNRPLLESHGAMRALELDWWDETVVQPGEYSPLPSPSSSLSSSSLSSTSSSSSPSSSSCSSCSPPPSPLLLPPSPPPCPPCLRVENLKVTAVPARHWSSRGPFDRRASLWCGFVVRGPSGSVYFAGDTGFGPHFAEIRERLGPPRLAILPIGAHEPRWFMSEVHISPEEAIEAHRLLGARTSAAMHFGTFRLADDGQDQPVSELRESLARQSISTDEFWILGFGEGRDVL